ncbi:glucuronate isomerase [Paenibacillus sp. FSL R7-0273]|uniref:glucuronate isomerase n=1 Tax=Paenibacillus sp. FSL R7-0273 TaxID=1536772 RepID=UPI0004F5E404|nr:glucuronate isomerase [Paenibacillus sp. FSL R7-0273]AIQ48495.1 glucuronate isomerase [Paenibacillus sp. FSL R7-0273]OMF86291.1 glucuronate isomerase [Paenibacillus sp. FSL R7-0273]
MKGLIQEDFLLQSEEARILYHEYAKALPIIDYHCHLDPQAIAENKRFNSITDVWLGGDHYKWRALRTFGVEEKYITGPASDEEKFAKWSEVLPYTIGNPLYHWSALELKRYFGVEEQLNPQNWREIYDHCNKLIATDGFTARGLITSSNVKWICTTDDPADALNYHAELAAQKEFKTGVTPTFRPDKAMLIGAETFPAYLASLEQAAGYAITSYDLMERALLERIGYFDKHGCMISDHGFTDLPFEEASASELEAIFSKRLSGQSLSKLECDQYATALFLAMGRGYAAHGWTMQLHIGALRNPNTRMFRKLGPDTGFDIIGDHSYAERLYKLLDGLDRTGELPKTIVYNLNGAQNDVLAAMIGAFQGEGIKGKVQFGSGWWYNDQKDGMIKQLTSLSNLGLLSCFVGMLTDSRSFLSYTRHEYFRRILCNLIGGWVVSGEAPGDLPFLGSIVQDICYNNAERYFGLAERC